MGYTKTTWSETTPLSSNNLNKAETQFDLAKADFDSHNHTSRYYTKTEADSTFWHPDNDGPGSGMDADLLYHSSGNKHASYFSGIGVPSGLIIMWYGSVANIPSGWALCNGSNGTVDLRDKFVYGNSSGDPSSGGSNSVTPTGSATIGSTTLTVSQIPSHRHSWNDMYSSGNSGGGTTFEGTSCSTKTLGDVSRTSGSTGGGQGHTHGGVLTFNAQENRPPFYALAFIQKV